MIAETTRALHDHELVKVKVSGMERDARDEALDLLASGTKSEIVGRIGHTAVLYRRNPEKTANAFCLRPEEALSRRAARAASRRATRDGGLPRTRRNQRLVAIRGRSYDYPVGHLRRHHACRHQTHARPRAGAEESRSLSERRAPSIAARARRCWRREIELRRHIERVAEQRRALPPGGPVTKDYRFDSERGPVGFAGPVRRQADAG